MEYIQVLKDNGDSRGSSENLGGEGHASDEEEVGGYNSGGDGAYSHAGKTGGDSIGGDDACSGHTGKVGGDNTGGDGAYSHGACNNEEEVGGHSCRDAFDFEENEEPWCIYLVSNSCLN